MAGNRAGGLKATATNKLKYGADYYVTIGKMGGQVTGTKKGFAADRRNASFSGAKGGRATQRKARAERELENLIQDALEQKQNFIQRLLVRLKG